MARSASSIAGVSAWLLSLTMLPTMVVLALRVAELVRSTVGNDAGSVVPPRRVGDDEVPAGVGARVAEPVVLGDHVGDERVARVALPDVDPRVGAAGRVDVIELTLRRVERIDAVVPVANRVQV